MGVGDMVIVFLMFFLLELKSLKDVCEFVNVVVVVVVDKMGSVLVSLEEIVLILN